MTAQIAYEAYRDHLNSRTRGWHDLKETAEHTDKSDEAFDTWLRANVAPADLTRYFMGEYDAMPEHTQRGWEAFAEHASEGAETAWNCYADAALTNYHKDNHIVLPRFEALAGDQQEAVRHAVEAVLAYRASSAPR